MLRPLLLAGLCVALAVSSSWAATVYFSPAGGARAALVHAIDEARSTVDVAVYNFTSAELARALFAARARGVRVRVLLDRERYEEGGATIQALRKSAVPVRVLGARAGALMHHKFAVFDRRLVATGSYNWTNAAEAMNFENLILLDDPQSVGRFRQEFSRLWRASGP